MYELTVPVAVTPALAPDDIATTVAAYHAEHHRQFTYAREELPVEFLHWRVTGLGLSDGAGAADVAPEARELPVPRSRNAFFPRVGDQPVSVYSSGDLAPGMSLAGPLVIESATTTVLLHGGDALKVAGDGSYVVDIAPVAASAAMQGGAPIVRHAQ